MKSAARFGLIATIGMATMAVFAAEVLDPGAAPFGLTFTADQWTLPTVEEGCVTYHPNTDRASLEVRTGPTTEAIRSFVCNTSEGAVRVCGNTVHLEDGCQEVTDISFQCC
jgi:hypothetical protein